MKYMICLQIFFLLSLCKSSDSTEKKSLIHLTNFSTGKNSIKTGNKVQTNKSLISMTMNRKPLKDLFKKFKNEYSNKNTPYMGSEFKQTKENYVFEDNNNFIEKKRKIKKNKVNIKKNKKKAHQRKLKLKIKNTKKSKFKKIKSCKNKKKPNKYKVKYIKNKLITKKDRKNSYKTTPCVIKTGLLYLFNLNGKIGKILKSKEMFIKLTPNIFSISKSLKSVPLHRIPLNMILRITQIYLKTFCFDIVLVHFPFDRLTICTRSHKQMNEWIHAILAFKHCKSNVSREIRNNNTLLKFSNITSSISNGYQGNDLHSLYYNNRDTAFRNNIHTIVRDSNINKHISNIVKTIKMGHLAHFQMRRQYAGRIKDAKKFASKVLKKEEMIKKIIQKQAQKERLKETNLLNLEHQHKEIKMLREVENKIRKMKLDELDHYRNHYESQIKLEKSKANTEAQNIFKLIMEQKKLTNFKVCYAKELYNFADKKHIKSLCKEYFGRSSMNQCVKKENFCEMCCEFHIGISYPLKRVKCKKKCSSRIKGNEIVTEKKKNLTNKLSNLITKLKCDDKANKKVIKGKINKLINEISKKKESSFK